MAQQSLPTLGVGFGKPRILVRLAARRRSIKWGGLAEHNTRTRTHPNNQHTHTHRHCPELLEFADMCTQCARVKRGVNEHKYFFKRISECFVMFVTNVQPLD